MKKMLLVLLFGMLCFSIESNAKTFAEFQADCERNPFSQLYYIDITYGGCDAKMLVCGNYMNSPGMYKLEYGPIYHIDPNCNILSAENLGNPDFWAAIDQQVIRKAELLHPFAIDCNDLVNGGIETDFEISRRPCQKIVFDMFSQETTLESCNDSENKCVITYSVCKHTVNSVVVYTAIKKSSYQFGFPQCSTTISTTMHQTNILNIYESDCFSVGCN